MRYLKSRDFNQFSVLEKEVSIVHYHFEPAGIENIDIFEVEYETQTSIFLWNTEVPTAEPSTFQESSTTYIAISSRKK